MVLADHHFVAAHQAKNIALMQQRKYGDAPEITNVPNAYLAGSRKTRREQILRALEW